MLASSNLHPPTSIDELISPALAAALDKIDLRSHRLFAGRLQGERRSKARGRSVEFEDFRQYTPGDDLRHVDWNVFARLDRFFIKIFQEEQDLALHIVLDASASMNAGTPSKLVCAQRIAMALGYLGLVNNNRVLVTIFGNGGIRRLPASRSRMSVPKLAKFLLEQTFARTEGRLGEQAAADGFIRAISAIAAEQTRGSGVLVLISDLLISEGYEQGVSLLAGGGGMGPTWDVTILQVLSPGELDPLSETDGSGGKVMLGDLRLTDVETGHVRAVTVSTALVEQYRKRLAAYQEKLHAFAAARGMRHVVVPSDVDVGRLMMEELRKVGVVE